MKDASATGRKPKSNAARGTEQMITGNTYPVREKLKALGARWNPADKCWMISSDKAEQARGIVGGQPPLNNPIAVPIDQGPVDVTAACSKYGRIPLATNTVPFRRSGKGSELGETFWGRDRGVRNRYLIVQESRPYYLSRTTLEDNDDFRSEPGHYRDVQAVAIEPTEKEIKDDPAVKKAKAEADAKRRSEIERAVQQGYNAQAGAIDPRSYRSITPDLVKVWGNTVYTMWVAGDHLVFRESSSDDWAQWEYVDAALAAEALALRVA